MESKDPLEVIRGLKPKDRLWLRCKREGSITLHRYEGPITGLNPITDEKLKKLFERWKDVGHYTCLKCLNTYSYGPRDLPLPEEDDRI